MHPLIMAFSAALILCGCNQSSSHEAAEAGPAVVQSVGRTLSNAEVCLWEVQRPYTLGQIADVTANRDGRTCRTGRLLTVMLPSTNGDCGASPIAGARLAATLSVDEARSHFARCTSVNAKTSSTPTGVIVYSAQRDEQPSSIHDLMSLYDKIIVLSTTDGLPVSSVGYRNDVVCIESEAIRSVAEAIHASSSAPLETLGYYYSESSSCNAAVPEVSGRPWEGHDLELVD